MRANLALGLAQGIFLPHPRPNRAWLAELGTDIEDAEPALAANAMSASAMWAANAATVSPAADTADGRCHLTVANLRTMPHRSHEWPATLAQLRVAFGSDAFTVHAPVPPAFGDEGAANHMRLAPAHAERGRRDFRLWRLGRRLPGAPASRSVQGRSRDCTGSIPSACYSPRSRKRRSRPAPSTTTWSRSRTSACCSRTSKPSPTRRR